MARWIGWLVVGLIVVAAMLPLRKRFAGERATPDSPTIRSHVAFGLSVALLALLHSIAVLGALGSSSAIGAGTWSFAAGAVAFFVLFAHVGVGLQLREPKLKRRADKRRTHLTTALIIAVAVSIHVGLLRLAS